MVSFLLLIFSLFYACSAQGEISTKYPKIVTSTERSLLDSGDNTFLMKIKNILREMNECHSKNEDLNKDILNIHKELADMKAHIEKNEKLLSGFQSTVSLCQNDVFELQEEVKTVRSFLNDTLSSVNSTLEIQVDNLKSVEEISNLNEEKISLVQSSVTLLSENFSDLQEGVSEVKVDVVHLDEDLESAAESISDVNTTLSEISDKITSVAEDVISLTKSNQKQEILIEDNMERLNNISERKSKSLQIDNTVEIGIGTSFL